MKAFLLFLSGALLGSIAAWFVWLGQVRPHDEAAQPSVSAPASVPVTQPPPQVGREGIAAQPERMIPVLRPVPGDTVPPAAAVAANVAPPAPVDSKQAVALPPESTPVAPVAAPTDNLAPPPPDLPPMRPLAL